MALTEAQKVELIAEMSFDLISTRNHIKTLADRIATGQADLMDREELMEMEYLESLILSNAGSYGVSL